MTALLSSPLPSAPTPRLQRRTWWVHMGIVAGALAGTTLASAALASAADPSASPVPVPGRDAALAALATLATSPSATRQRVQAARADRHDQTTSEPARAEAPGTPEALSLYVGQIVMLPAPDLQRVAIGSGKVISARIVDERNLLVIAQDAGDTTLHLWRKDGSVRELRVRVDVPDTGRIADELRQLTGPMPGVSILRIGDKVVIDSVGLDPQLAPRLAAIAKLYPQATLLPTSERVDMAPMVDIEVKIMALSKSAQDDLGVRWQSAADGFNFGVLSDIQSNGNYRVLPDGSPFNPSGGSGIVGGALTALQRTPRSYFGLATTLNSKLQLLVQRGEAVLIATPNLTTRSGGEAKFLAGGEFPLPSVGAFGGSVEFKPYGVLLNIKPRADRQGTVAGSVLAEVSNIDPAVAVQGIPGLLIRRTETEFNLASGETIVLSGLVSHDNSRATDGLPGLRNIPLLGQAFRSNSATDKESEVLVFMTPRVVASHDSDARIQQTAGQAAALRGRFGDLIKEEAERAPAPPPTPRSSTLPVQP